MVLNAAQKFRRRSRRQSAIPCALLIVAGVLAGLISKAGSLPDEVTLAWSQKGLTSIRFGNHEYLAFGEFNLSRVNLVDSAGQSQPVSLQSLVRVDQAANTETSTFAWGSVETRFRTTHNVLELVVRVKNTSPFHIAGLSFEPLRVRFDAKPIQYDGSIPILADNISTPGVLLMSTGDEAVVLANDDPAKPLSIGFPWALDRPRSTEFPIRIVTGREPMYPDMTPLIDRPVLPGTSDVYKVSLTFGERGEPPNDLLSGIYRRLAAIYPPTLHWPDRRPIGMIVLATANAGFPGNPRGWFLDRSLDTSTKRGREHFRSELMKWADTSIRILHSMNAQGAVTWDIEGEQYAHPTTYIGDPRLIDTLDPEMSACADAYFRRFRDQGFRVGVTLRPQQFVRSASGDVATQQPVGDPVKLLNDKIRYAKERWGATLFYVDSNGDPNYPMDSNVFREVALADPGVLLIPEHSNPLYYAVSAPYGELRRGVTGASPIARQLYPKSFRVINTSDGNVPQHLTDLKAAIQQGDIVMFRAWFDDPANTLLRDIAYAHLSGAQ